MTATAAGWFGLTSRDSAEQHRAATPLELLFDLTLRGRGGPGRVRAAPRAVGRGARRRRASPATCMVFFAIWWAWMNFTWFASAYDTDDVPYRLLTLCRSPAPWSSPPASRPRSSDTDFDRGHGRVRGHAGRRSSSSGCAPRPGTRPAGPWRSRYAAGITAVPAGLAARLLLPRRRPPPVAASSCWSSPSSPCRCGRAARGVDRLAPRTTSPSGTGCSPSSCSASASSPAR